MRLKKIAVASSVVIGIAASLLLIASMASAQPASRSVTSDAEASTHLQPAAAERATQAISVTFPPGDQPWYAQNEITVHPTPPRAGRPTELCAEVVNLDPDNPHTVTLEFSVANFGIGVPFIPVGRVELVVPPGGHARGCVPWVPREPGHWCIQAAIIAPGQEPQISQRNIDIWEPLKPGEPQDLVFHVGPQPEGGRVTFVLTNHLQMEGWEVQLIPGQLDLPPDKPLTVTLRTIPPLDAILGTRRTVADVEGFLNGIPVGGFRKLDGQPVPLHRPRDPFFAESELSVMPYPPRAGEPTQICVELTNLSDVPQTVKVQFSWANFGIGLPFAPIDGPIEVTLPPHSDERVCIWWVPPFQGHFCVQVRLDILGPVAYVPQFSQLNLDVAEPLKPGVPHVTQFAVGNHYNEFTNPEPLTTDIWLEKDFHLPGWEVELTPMVLQAMAPGEVREVTMVVTPPLEPLPPDGTPVVDVRALMEPRGAPMVIGGFRKVYRPPVPLHRFPDPPYAEREITVHPYPPRAGEPTEICVELYNPTPFPQEVVVQFSWANFGIGIPFTPINGPRVVHLPPFSTVKECIHWIPPISGHVCLQVELHVDDHPPQRSQRNIDVYEPLIPGQGHTLRFPVGNPLGHPVSITLGLIQHLDGWEFELWPVFLPGMKIGEQRTVSLTVIPPPGLPLPPDDTPIVDVEAYAEGQLIGGFRKIHRPPIPLHPFPDPPYAEREITVEPYPPRAGEPTEICVELRNPTPFPKDVVVQFSWANFGIGIPFTPINGPRLVHLPPFSIVKECIHWIPPVSGHVCLQVELFVDDYPPQRSQRNIDVDEPLIPGEPHSRVFPVGNPFEVPVTITLGLIPHLPSWGLELSDDVLPDVGPGETRPVTLTVTPPRDEPLPEDGMPIVDVEAYVRGEPIGGFRKIFRPPVPIHRPKDPIYAESEIFVHPYPPRAREPTELGVEIRNPTDHPQTVTVTFSYANFGIGLPFTPINGPVVVTVPPHGIIRPVIIWLPPHGGLWCIQVEIQLAGHDEPFYSQRNIDVGEPLEPKIPHSRVFLVGNPYTQAVSMTLGLIPHLPDWGLELSQDLLPDLGPGETRPVTLTVTPPADLPPDGQPIVDVEAFVEGELVGGFRKIFRPPVPVHRPKDPIYAESEIGVDPYPVLPDQPTELSVEVFNPTQKDEIVTATFSIARFGIGLPFSTTHITPNPIRIFVPAHGAARGHVIWLPPRWRGKFCVRVTLEMKGHEPIWSQRNIDVGEPLRPGLPHSLVFPVGSWPYTQPMTVTLGLINHRDGWDVSLSHQELPSVPPGQPMSVTLTVTPPVDARLGTGEPIVDVEAFVEGELIGGFRKLDRPPIPLHKPHEKGYAESEIMIHPDPPRLGEEARVSTVVQNSSEQSLTVELEFGWAKFGMGIPFTTTGMSPYTRSVTLGPEMSATTWVSWTPTLGGPQCVRIFLKDSEGLYERQESQRNVDVVRRPPCGETKVYTFTVQNHSPFSATVEIGMVTFDVPPEWEVMTVPSDTLELGPYATGVVTVTVRIPCPPTFQAMQTQREMVLLQQEAGGVPTIDVEGYIKGDLVGGIELRFSGQDHRLYLPLVLKQS